jgi:hypothetical protein
VTFLHRRRNSFVSTQFHTIKMKANGKMEKKNVPVKSPANYHRPPGSFGLEMIHA